MNKLMSPADLMELSKIGKEAYKESVLSGPTLKKIIENIEDSALKGYTGWRKKLTSNDDLRELKIIKDYLCENGYDCEFKTEKKKSLIAEYYERYFVISWEKNNPTSCN
ncbi:hypothetical protein NST63_27530 [Heyndrickxia sp. FSL W8-0496]|uniref:hypothetical protein n=1 Tax=Heyndrickxia sp. FSL W8-0496 TaxID=2954702 RepID=UPI0030FBB39D